MLRSSSNATTRLLRRQRRGPQHVLLQAEERPLRVQPAPAVHERHDVGDALLRLLVVLLRRACVRRRYFAVAVGRGFRSLSLHVGDGECDGVPLQEAPPERVAVAAGQKVTVVVGGGWWRWWWGWWWW